MAKNTNCFFDEIKKQKKLIMTNPRHPNPIHENRPFSWTKCTDDVPGLSFAENEPELFKGGVHVVLYGRKG